MPIERPTDRQLDPKLMAIGPDDLTTPTHVIGIGASAGGLEAIERFFRAMPTDSGMAFVVIQHLSPDFKSLMDELIGRFTSMPIRLVSDRINIHANTIYLLPPKKDMVIAGRELISTDRSDKKTLNLPINTFFSSLANTWGGSGIAIVLSGTGSDGSMGIRDVHKSGGLVLIQSEESSRFDGMPRSAMDTGSYDAILCPEDMPAAITAYASDPKSRGAKVTERDVPLDEGLNSILQRLQSEYGIDFSQYKPQTIYRRIERRINLYTQCLSLEDYCRRITEDATELDALCKDLLIGVTSFFRDPEAFDELARTIIPIIMDRRDATREIRVWVAGCSTGEEAYSIAILFMEASAERNLQPHVKILATDLNRDALLFAAEGIYPESRFVEMPIVWREKYFINQGNGTYKVTADLRKALIFSEHNLLKDPPFRKIDLVICRNLLIYFQSQFQARALACFHFALRLGGFLMLGSSEGLGELSNEFKEESRSLKLFSKIRENRQLSDLRNPPIFATPRGQRPIAAFDTQLIRVYDLLLRHIIPTGILVNEAFEVVHVFGDAVRYLHTPVGRMTSDLFSMVVGDLKIALLTTLRSAALHKKTVTFKNIQSCAEEVARNIDITVEPLIDRGGVFTYFLVQLLPSPQKETVTPSEHAVLEMDRETSPHLQYLETELQQTRESLQSAVEELETSNEELQATNEELLASNEELQSTNEELHSVNEELYSVNAEHESKIQELNITASNLSNLLRSTDLATVFLDTHLCIRLFTPRVTEIFPVLAQDIGRDIRHFAPNFRDQQLFFDLENALRTHSSCEHELNWEGERIYLRRISPYQDGNNQMAGLVLTYVDISRQRQAELAQASTEHYFRMLAANTGDWFFTQNLDGKPLYNSPAVSEITGYAASEAIFAEKLLENILLPDDFKSYVDAHANLPERGEIRMDLRLQHRNGSVRWIEHHSRPMFDDNGQHIGRCGANRDITHRIQAEAQNRKLLLALDQSPISVMITDTQGIIEYVNQAYVKVSGYSVSETLGQKPSIQKSGEVQPEVYSDLWKTLNKGQCWEGEITNRHKDGTLYIEHQVVTPIREHNGVITHYLAVKEDITERKRIELDLERYRNNLEAEVELRSGQISELNEQLKERALAAEAANKAKSDFLANMSHEIRTPMTAIIGFTRLLQKTITAPNEARKLANILQASDHLLHIINDILDISKIEADKVVLEQTCFDLDSILEKNLDQIIPGVNRKQLEFIVDIDPEIGEINGDALRLSQALLNYLSNAIKFTEQGNVTLKARIIETNPADVLIRFEVRDTGIGIDSESIPRLFNAFEQADNSTTRRYGGTGLGLALTQRIARLMGGETGVDSLSGVGSTFWMTARFGRVSDTVNRYYMANLAGRRALVIDGNQVTRLVHAQLIKMTGLQCEMSASCQEAVGLLCDADAGQNPYDLILVDQINSEVAGVSFLDTLRASLSKMPIVWLVTSEWNVVERLSFSPKDFDDVIFKPLTATRLHAALERYSFPLINPANSVAETFLNSQEDVLKMIKRDFADARLLFVEDDLINQFLITQILSDVGWAIDVADDGNIGLEKATNQIYDLILMDMQMPNMDGLTATRLIRELPNYRNVPIIALTANVFSESQSACLEAGMNDVLTKPIYPETLYGKLYEWLRRTRR